MVEAHRCIEYDVVPNESSTFLSFIRWAQVTTKGIGALSTSLLSLYMLLFSFPLAHFHLLNEHTHEIRFPARLRSRTTSGGGDDRHVNRFTSI